MNGSFFARCKSKANSYCVDPDESIANSNDPDMNAPHSRKVKSALRLLVSSADNL